MIVWGARLSSRKAADSAVGPGAFLFCRSLLMSALAMALLCANRLPVWPRPDGAEWRLLLVATGLAQVGHVSRVTFGIHGSTPLSSALIMACGPVITLVLLRVLQGARMRPPQILGVGAALAGALIFLADKPMKTELRASGGDAFLLLSAVFSSLYTIRVTPLVQRQGRAQVMRWSTLLAAPPMMVATV